MRYSGNVDGAIVCLGIRHGVLTLIVMDGEVVMCVCSAVCTSMLYRVCGIAPKVLTALGSGYKVHIDVRAFVPSMPVGSWRRMVVLSARTCAPARV